MIPEPVFVGLVWLVALSVLVIFGYLFWAMLRDRG